MMFFMSNKVPGKPGKAQTKKENYWSHLSLKTHVYQQPVLTLSGVKKVSLNPKLIQEL